MIILLALHQRIDFWPRYTVYTCTKKIAHIISDCLRPSSILGSNFKLHFFHVLADLRNTDPQVGCVIGFVSLFAWPILNPSTKKSPFLQDSPRKTPWFFLVKALLFHNIILNPRNSPVFLQSINPMKFQCFFSFFPMSFPFFHHFAPGELPRGTPPGSPGSPLRRVAPRQLRDGPGRCLGGAGHGGGHLGAGQCLGDVSSWGIIYG